MPENWTDLLDTAIELEEEGFNFYIKAAKDTLKNSLSKAVFQTLAKDEVHHKEEIKRFCDSLRGKGKAPEFETPSGKPYSQKLPEDIKEVFDKMQKSLDVAADESTAYKAAMDLETKGYKYYETLRQKSQDSSINKLLDFLMNQEKEHYSVLQDTLTYLDKPDQWFLEQEKPIVEG